MIDRSDGTSGPRASGGELIRCPSCRGSLLRARRDDAVLGCDRCGAEYPVRDGVVDLLGDAPRRRSLAQWTMEWEPVVRIYESRLWRRGFVFAIVSGLTFDEEHRLVAESLHRPEEGALLDLGCGPGIHTRPFARERPRGLVVGLDLSSPMLRHASEIAGEEGLTNVAWIHGDALDLPFTEERFDAVSCCGALHLFPDVPRALSEIHRVLKPGGRFATAVFRRAGTRPISRWDHALDERLLGMSSYGAPELTAALCAAGFEDVRPHHDRRIWLIMSASKPADSAESGNPRPARSSPSGIAEP